MATRGSVGLYDVYYQGPIDIKGPDAQTLLDHVLARDVPRRLATDGQVLYASMCNEAGGMIDDLTAYRLGSEHYWLIATPATGGDRGTARHRARPRSSRLRHELRLGDRVPLRAGTGRTCAPPAVHVCGSRERASAVLPVHADDGGGRADAALAHGLFGELGYELYYPRDFALHMWDTLIGGGRDPVRPRRVAEHPDGEEVPAVRLGRERDHVAARGGSGLGRRPGRRAVHRPRRVAAPARRRDRAAPHRGRARRSLARARRRRRRLGRGRTVVGRADVDGSWLVPGQGARVGVSARRSSVRLERAVDLRRWDLGGRRDLAAGRSTTRTGPASAASARPT